MLGDQHRIGGIGDVPDLMPCAAERAQHVDRVGIALRQGLAVADAHHLRAAGFVFAFLAGNVMQIFRMRGIGDVDDRGAVRLGLAGHRIDRIGNLVGAAVMADIGDPAVALMMDGRLIGAARLQVVVADQLHVGGFGRRADHLLLLLLGCRSAHARCRRRTNKDAKQIASLTRPFMSFPPRLFKSQSRAGCARR